MEILEWFNVNRENGYTHKVTVIYGKIRINQMDLQAHNFQTNPNGRPSGCIYHMILITKTLVLIVF